MRPPRLGSLSPRPRGTFGAGITQPISGGADYTGFELTITATPNSASAAQDALAYVGSMEIVAPDGTIILMNPIPDFYTVSQRFSPTGTAPAQVKNSTGTPTVTASYTIMGVNLPAAKGPYTVIWTNVAAAVSGETTLSVAYTMTMIIGATGGNRTRFKASSFAPGAVTAAEVDYSQTFPVQGPSLEELFITPPANILTQMSIITVDVNQFTQIQSLGSPIASGVTPAYLNGVAQAQLNGTLGGPLATYVIYLCLGLGTQITLGSASNLFIKFGTVGSGDVLRFGGYWFD